MLLQRRRREVKTSDEEDVSRRRRRCDVGGRERAVERDAQTSKGRLRDARGSILAVARLALSLAVQSLIQLGQSF